MIDFSRLASLTPEQAIALIRQEYGSGAGRHDDRQQGAVGPTRARLRPCTARMRAKRSATGNPWLGALAGWQLASQIR